MLDSWPYAAVFAFFFAVVMARTNATYWAGRGLRVAGSRSRLQRRLDGPGVARAERLVARWGAPLVAASFLTVGVQTVVNAAAGSLRMPLRRYVPATVVGSLAWAGLYTTVGFAFVEAWTDRVPWVAVGVVVVALGLGVVVGRRLRRAP